MHSQSWASGGTTGAHQEQRIVSQRWVIIPVDQVGLVLGRMPVEKRLHTSGTFR